MIRKYFLLFTITVLWAHDPKENPSQWKIYLRGGIVSVDENNLGGATYSRLKRTTGYTFQDVRFFGHIFKEDQDIRVRYKFSEISLNLPRFYNFTTVSFQRNSLVNVDLRYHYNQGLGLFLSNTDSGNMTAEMGIAYDMSDYLEDTRKTSYLKTAFSYDLNTKNISTKLELEYFHQISDIVNENNLSRFQILGELHWSFYKNMKLIGGIYQELPGNKSYNEKQALLYLTIAFNKPLKWHY